MAEELAEVSNEKLIPLNEVLMTDFTLQLSIGVLIAGFVSIIFINKKISQWIETKPISYSRPFFTEFIKKTLFSLFTVALFAFMAAYIQIFELFDSQSAIDAAMAFETLTPREVFAKILDTFVILVVGFTVVNLIPIILALNEAKKAEKQDYREWIHKRGFADDEQDLFHQIFEWSPPKHCPPEISEKEFKEKLGSKEGRKFLENYYTSQGIPIGSFKQKQSNAFESWQESERKKYQKYLDNCTSGNNDAGQVLRLGVYPREVYTVTLWREQKRVSNYDPIIPGARPPGWAERQSGETPRSFRQIIPLVGMLALLIGIAAWWEVDLVVVATASGGLAIGIGFAMQETMQNYFAYLSIKKDKIFVEGDRIKLDM